MGRIAGEQLKKCPYCAEEIQPEAIKCKHCGEWLTHDPMSNIKIDGTGKPTLENNKEIPTIDTGENDTLKSNQLEYELHIFDQSNINEISQANNEPLTVQPYSYFQPIGRLVFLWVTTFGVYIFYWFYKTAKQLKNHRNLRIQPGWQTLGLIVPILNLVLLQNLFVEIDDSAEEVGVTNRHKPVNMLGATIILNLMYRLPHPAYILGLLGVIPFAMLQNTLNQYWSHEFPESAIRKSFYWYEIVFASIGICIWILVIIGFFIGNGKA